MEPATQLPSDDEPWWKTVEEFQEGVAAFLRKGDWSGAERLAVEYSEKASGPYEAAIYALSRSTALAALGRKAESLEASRLAERLVPVEPQFKIRLAQRLIAEFGQPQEGLAKLEEVEPLLREPGERSAWLGEKGLCLLVLKRAAEAVECFRELARPERLAKMRDWDYIGLVDFRLVSGLVWYRLVPELCVAYLEAAEAIAARHNPDQVDKIRNLLALARDPGAERPAYSDKFPGQLPPLYTLC